MLKNVVAPRNPIGNETIHIETQQAAIDILEEFEKHEVSPLLISQPQQGKTGVQIAVVDSFIETCKLNAETYQVILIINMSDNDLFAQSALRFRNAQLRDVEIYHHAKLNKILLKPVDKRLIIIDESHFALGDGKPFHTFMQRCGISYGKPISTWGNKNNFVLSVSATPYATVIRQEIDDIKNNPTFKKITLNVSKSYYSLIDLIKSNRLDQSESLVDDKDDASLFFEDRLDKFLQACKKYGPGYWMVRGKGASCKAIEDACKKHGILKETYSSSKKDDFKIESLDLNISGAAPLHPTVIIIKGALRAGKTLTSTKNIRRWTETENSNPDAIAQVIGRCLGYPDKISNHSKFKDVFEIDCDLSAINEAALFYGFNKLIPAGNNNNKGYEESKIYEWKRAASEQEARLISGSLDCGTVSKNIKHDVCKIIANAKVWSERSRAITLDGPSSSMEFDGQLSWNELLKKFPDWKPGDIVYAVEGKMAVNNTLSEKTIKPKTLLSSVPYVPKGHNNAPTFAVKNKSLRIQFFDKREDAVAAALIAYGNHPDWETSIKYSYGISTQDKRDVVDFILRGVNPYASQRIWFLDKANPNYLLSWEKLVETYPNCVGTYVLCLEDKGPQLVSNGLNEELIKENSLLRS